MFYILPPKGLVTLHLLDDIALSRLQYLNALQKKEKTEFSGSFEHLLEGSINDCIGHFILRLIASGSNEFLQHWLGLETLLFKQRLIHIHPRQLLRLLSTIKRHLRRRDQLRSPLTETLYGICEFFQQTEVFKHLFNSQHSEDCCLFSTKVHFSHVPDLVEKRSVDLHKGWATIYCAQWQQVLASIFYSFTFEEIERWKSSLRQIIFTDPRICSLNQKILGFMFTRGIICSTITALDMDEEVQKFPPCMNHLHWVLRRRHRLSHYARFYYTLFLKDCGMSLDEAFAYWRAEYTKPHDCTSVCTHNWQTDIKKFTYSIRHIYGLEGGMKNYESPSCKDMAKNAPGPSYEGGCPFVNFDSDSLKLLLQSSMSLDEVDGFMTKIEKLSPVQACTTLFQIKSGSTCTDLINKPKDYYMKMTKPN